MQSRRFWKLIEIVWVRVTRGYWHCFTTAVGIPLVLMNPSQELISQSRFARNVKISHVFVPDMFFVIYSYAATCHDRFERLNALQLAPEANVGTAVGYDADVNVHHT